MKVKQAMHKGVQWVGPGTSVNKLAKLMREHDIGAIPIGENDRLIGIPVRLTHYSLVDGGSRDFFLLTRMYQPEETADLR